MKKSPRTSKSSRSISIKEILEQRGSEYGPFLTQARVVQSLKYVMHSSSNWDLMADDQKEALEMVQHKIGRILNGNPDNLDSWVDQIGYLQLVVDRLEEEK